MKKSFIILSLIVSSLFIAACAGAPGGKEIPADRVGSFIDVDGQRLRYYQAGRGDRDILFIHGLPGMIEDWLMLFPSLVDDFRLTAFDRPGHGFSSEEGALYNIEGNKKTALALIRKLGLKDVIVVGHSYGGSIALAMALENPPEVAAYVTVGGAAYPQGESDPLLMLVRMPLLGRSCAGCLLPLAGEGMVVDGLAEALYPDTKNLTPTLIKTASGVFLLPRVAVSLAEEEGTISDDLAAQSLNYKNISKPLFIVQGMQDKLVPGNQAVRLHNDVANSELTMLEDVGHYVQITKPGAVIDAIRKAAGK